MFKSIGKSDNFNFNFYYPRQYEKAIEFAKITLDIAPNFFQAHRLLSLAYAGLEMFDEAIAENQRWGDGTANKVKTDIALAYIYASSGTKEDARKIIEETGVNKFLSGNDYRGMALIYTALGNYDKAFEWLEKSYQMHEESLCSLNVDPKFDPIRNDARFERILKKIGL